MHRIFVVRAENVVAVYEPILKVSMLGSVCTLTTDKKGDKLRLSYFATALTTSVLIWSIFHLFLIPKAIVYIEIMLIQGQVASPTEERLNIESYDDLPYEHFLSKIVKPSVVTVVSICCRFVILTRMAKKLTESMEILKTVDNSLKLNNTHHKRNIFVLYGMIFILITAGVPFQIYTILYASKNPVYILLFCANFYNNFGTTCTELQFTSLCYLLYSRFAQINRKIEILGNALEKQVHKRPIITNASSVSGIIDTLSFGFPPNNFETTYDTALAKKLRILRFAYHQLSETSTKINNLYSVQLLLSLSSCALNMLLQLYYAIFGGYTTTSTKDIQNQPIGEILSSIGWGAYYFFRFFVLCVVPARVTNEGNATRILLCKIFHRNLEPSIKEELWNFLLYTLVREIKFTVCGLFQLDLTLITKAIATGATYLVILIQFHQNN